MFLVCEVIAAVNEFEAGGNVRVLEGVTESEEGWYDGAVMVFAQEGGRAWFGGGDIDGFVGENGIWLREAGSGG